jgi:hypothetical protein
MGRTSPSVASSGGGRARSMRAMAACRAAHRAAHMSFSFFLSPVVLSRVMYRGGGFAHLLLWVGSAHGATIRVRRIKYQLVSISWIRLRRRRHVRLFFAIRLLYIPSSSPLPSSRSPSAPPLLLTASCSLSPFLRSRFQPPTLTPSSSPPDGCPVSCIHWVNRTDLPPLEFVMQVKMTTR